MRRLAPAFLVTVTVLACGPSLRLVQQSSVYFERCYSADFDARVPPAEKRACWEAWLQHYTSGVSAERRDYARERIYAIEHGEVVPRLPGLPEAVVAQRVATFTAASITEPEEVGVESESELEMAEHQTVPDEGPEPAPEPRPAPQRPHRMPALPPTANQACAMQACQPLWEQCVQACAPEARDCLTACRVELNGCARGCF